MKMPSQKSLFHTCLVLSGFAIAAIFYLLSTYSGSASSNLKGIFSALQPIFVGIIMTYLLYPLSNNCEQLLLQKKANRKLARIVSVAAAALFILALFFLFGYLVLPKLVSSITILSGNFSTMLSDFIESSSAFLAGLGLPADSIASEWEKAGAKFMAWLQKDLMNTLYSITNGIFTVAKVAINLLIGIIVMIYLLYSRDHFIGQSKKLLYAICPNRKLCSVILESVRQINMIFGGFLTGKVIDSLIIGAICFVCLTILHIPYVMIISVVVGVTNIIPVFGPFIGAIPSAFLLLLTDPAKCLVFIVFIIILQQVDGNVIGPMILGDSTGLPAFWVLFSLLLFQHLLGFWGMIIGVPLFASIYYLLKQLVNHLLRKRHLPISTLEYVSIEGIAEDGSPVYLESNHKKSFFRIKQKRKREEQSKHAHK